MTASRYHRSTFYENKRLKSMFLTVALLQDSTTRGFTKRGDFNTAYQLLLISLRLWLTKKQKKKKVYFLWGKVHKRNICGKKAFWSQNQQLSLSACVVSALCSIYCGWHISNLAQFCIDSISSLTIWRDSSGFVTSKTTNNHFFSNQRSINQNQLVYLGISVIGLVNVVIVCQSASKLGLVNSRHYSQLAVFLKSTKLYLIGQSISLFQFMYLVSKLIIGWTQQSQQSQIFLNSE